MDFILVIIELFSLGAMVQALRANIDWKSMFLKGWVSLWPKISGRGLDVRINYLYTVR